MSRLARYTRSFRLPLNDRQIRRALKLGLGRVDLHRIEYGLGAHREALVRACLKNMVYDAQCEPSRADWLVPMLEPEVEKEVLSRLVTSIPTANQKDLHQYCELLLLLAKKGRKTATEALYSAFQIDDYGDPLAFREILELDGARGLVRVCQMLLDQGNTESLDGALDRIVDIYDLEYGNGEAESVIRRSPELRTLLPYFETIQIETTEPEAQDVRQHSKKSVKNLTVNELLTIIDSTTAPYYIQAVSLWARAASEEQLEELGRVLVAERSVHRLRHILSIFRRRTIPNFEDIKETCLKLSGHEDWHVKHRTNDALSQVSHPAIRELALSQLRAQRWLEGELRLFCSNLAAGDSAHFAQQLRVDRNAYNHHRLIFGLVEVCQCNPWPEMLEVMLFVYQTSPCTNCRYSIYETMSQAGLTPGWVASEWPYNVEART